MGDAGPSFPKSIKIVRGISGKMLLEVLMMSEQKRPYRFSPLESKFSNRENNKNLFPPKRSAYGIAWA
jgi:hypothetical protein